MHSSTSRLLTALCAATAAVATAAPASAAHAVTGPNTTTKPYLLPVARGAQLTSLLTVADQGAAGNGYELVGVPDGIGTYRSPVNAGRTVALVNHELRETEGIVRRHGEKGAFVSRLRIDNATNRVVSGEDLIRDVHYYQYRDAAYGQNLYASTPQAPVGAAEGHTAAFSRFCSGYLSAPGTLQNAAKTLGFDGQLYFANEETSEGRVFAVTLGGDAYQLPRLGLFSWENSIVAPTRTAATVVMGNEDSSVGELHLYAGRKTSTGSAVQKAGLTNGRDFVLKVPGIATDAAYRAAYGKGKAAAFSLQDVEWNQNGAAQNAEAAGEGGLGFNRIEDGAFNPANRNEYYFNTTEGGDTTQPPGVTNPRDGGGLWKVTFKDVDNPELGGKLELVLDGSEWWGPRQARINKPDNMTISRDGHLLIQEDPGGNDHVARVLSFRLRDRARGVVATFDPALFGVSDPAGTTTDERAVLTTDEESSGIVQTHDGSFLLDAQVHTDEGLPAGPGRDTVDEYVQRAQLLRLRVTDWSSVYTVVPGYGGSSGS